MDEEQQTADAGMARLCPKCGEQTSALVCPKCRNATAPAALVEPTRLDMVGQRLGNQYELLDVVGRGGMGVVYRAIQLSMEREVAVKVISASFMQDPQVLRRFEREAKVTSKLIHPNTIRVYDFGHTDAGVFYLVMELLEGQELSKEIKAAGQMPLERTLSISIQTLKSLQEAHAHGIVHRDLKPANIFLQQVPGQEEVVKVMDFGIAKLVQNSETANLTQAGLLVGTPHYMSPEQVSGAEVGPRSDIYSLGIILYQMLAGRLPFNSDTPVGVLMMQAHDPPPPLGGFRPDLAAHRSLHEVVNQFLAKDPQLRPGSAQHAIALLQRLRLNPESSNPEITALDPSRAAGERSGQGGGFSGPVVTTPLKNTDGGEPRSVLVSGFTEIPPATPELPPTRQLGTVATEELTREVDARTTPAPHAQLPDFVEDTTEADAKGRPRQDLRVRAGAALSAAVLLAMVVALIWGRPGPSAPEAAEPRAVASDPPAVAPVTRPPVAPTPPAQAVPPPAAATVRAEPGKPEAARPRTVELVRVELRSLPKGARARVQGGTESCDTPCSLVMDRGHATVITFERSGYAREERQLVPERPGQVLEVSLRALADAKPRPVAAPAPQTRPAAKPAARPEERLDKGRKPSDTRPRKSPEPELGPMPI